MISLSRVYLHDLVTFVLHSHIYYVRPAIHRAGQDLHQNAHRCLPTPPCLPCFLVLVHLSHRRADDGSGPHATSHSDMVKDKGSSIRVPLH